MLRTTTVSVEGHSISYATEGTGPVLLLLHGMLFDSRMWEATIPYLAGHMRVVAPNLTIESFSPDVAVRLLAGLITNLQAVPCFVAGSGFGGVLALALAARYPERVRAVFAVGSAGDQVVPEARNLQVAYALRHVPGVLRLGTRLFPGFTTRQFLRVMHAQGALPAEIEAHITRRLRLPESRRSLLQAWRGLAKWRDLKRLYGGIRAPTLLIWGEHDQVYSLKSAERLRHMIPGAQLVTLEGSGHLLPAERPAELAAIMRQFIAPALRAPASRTIQRP